MDELWGGSGPPGPPLIYATGSEEEAVPAPADASNNANKSGVEEKVIA
jgi:hypothetical protein